MTDPGEDAGDGADDDATIIVGDDDATLLVSRPVAADAPVDDPDDDATVIVATEAQGDDESTVLVVRVDDSTVMLAGVDDSTLIVAPDDDATVLVSTDDEDTVPPPPSAIPDDDDTVIVADDDATRAIARRTARVDDDPTVALARRGSAPPSEPSPAVSALAKSVMEPPRARRRDELRPAPVPSGFGGRPLVAVGVGAVSTYRARPLAPPPVRPVAAGASTAPQRIAGGTVSVARRSRRASVAAIGVFAAACVLLGGGVVWSVANLIGR